jgi:hypothetical protein
MKKKIRKLETEYNFQLIGISCAEEDYKLCWLFNRALEFDFERIDELEIMLPDKQLEFAVFEYQDQEAEVTYHLIANRNQQGILVAEERQSDYFLKISGDFFSPDLPELVSSIRQIPNVMAAYPLVPKKIKSIDNLLF